MKRVHIFSAVLIVLFSSISSAEIAIICNPSVSITGIDVNTASNIFLGKSDDLGGGIKVKPIEHEEGNDVKIQFHKAVTKKSAAQLKSYWSRLLFTGKGKPPKEVFDDDEAKELIANDPSLISYIDKASADDSVKVLLTIP